MIRKWAFDYKVGSQSSVRPLVVTGLVAGIAALALALAAPATGGASGYQMAGDDTDPFAQ